MDTRDSTSPEHAHFTVRPTGEVDGLALRDAFRLIDGVAVAELLTDGSVDVFTHRPDHFTVEARRAAQDLHQKQTEQPS